MFEIYDDCNWKKIKSFQFMSEGDKKFYAYCMLNVLRRMAREKENRHTRYRFRHKYREDNIKKHI